MSTPLDRAEILARVDSYVAALDAHDAAASTAHFAVDARSDDPVGDEPHVGHDQIRAFFDEALARPFSVSLEGAVAVHRNWASFRLRFVTPREGQPPVRMVIDDLVEFAPDGRFASLRAVPDATI